jgi:pyruvate dehydrogenase E2 component (dihydrolipoamide acetyltransferase)
VARRVAETKATIPEVTLACDIDVEEARSTGVELEALVITACGRALREVPRANGSYRDAGFELYSRANVGFTVDTGDGLVVPTIFDADARPAMSIAAERTALTQRARDGEITSPELAGGTFTIMSVGAPEGGAIIHGGQAAILALGTPERRAVVRDGGVAVRTTLRATLVCDHRILYGDAAAAFLEQVRALLEQPADLLS